MRRQDRCCETSRVGTGGEQPTHHQLNLLPLMHPQSPSTFPRSAGRPPMSYSRRVYPPTGQVQIAPAESPRTVASHRRDSGELRVQVTALRPSRSRRAVSGRCRVVIHSIVIITNLAGAKSAHHTRPKPGLGFAAKAGRGNTRVDWKRGSSLERKCQRGAIA